MRAETRIVGRDAEMQMLREALDARRGAAGIVLEGDAGIGKTAIWQAGIAAAEGRGARTLKTRATAAESTLSHAGLADLLGPMADTAGVALAGPQRRALDVALLWADAPGAQVDARAVGLATLGLLRAAVTTAPLLLAIDDVQWLDAASGAALRFALRRVASEPITLLATHRLGQEAGGIDTGLDEERVSWIPVGPLSDDALQKVLRQRLGVPIPRPALVRLLAVSRGNPYHAIELARAALREAPDGRLRADLPLPEGIYAVLQDRLRTLPRDTRDALGAVAALGQPTTAAVGAAVDVDALDPAFADAVVHEEGDRIDFDHPLLADAAYRLLPPARRRAVHRRLADLAPNVEERGRHLAAATTSPDASVAAEIETGATAAAARGAPAAAAQLFEQSARLEPVVETAANRRIAAVRQHIAAGDGRRSMALARALVDELPPGPLRARALVALADQEGDLDEFIGYAEQAVAEAGEDRETTIDALVTLGYYRVIAGREEEGYEDVRRAVALCDASTPTPLRIKAMIYYGEQAAWRGDPDGVRLLREAAYLEGGTAMLEAGRGPGTVLGRTLMFGDELDESRRLLEDRYQRSVELGDDESRAAVGLHLAELEIKDGRLDAALRYAEEGMAIQEGSYGGEGQSAVSYTVGLVRALRGELVPAREVLESGLARSEANNDAIFAAIHRAVLGFLDLSVGDAEAAVDRFAPLAAAFRASPQEPGLPHFALVPDAVETLVAVGRLEDAQELLDAWEEAGERFDRPRVRATAARCRALLAAASGDVEHAHRHAEDAVKRSRELPLRFDLARSLIVQGSLLRRTRKKAAARAALEEAAEILDEMGAALWGDRARAELARIGGRAASGGLTPTEQRVADLVAEGRSNKEVAAELFVSVRTVEANLTRVYSKLGIRSRTELAATRQARE